MSAPNLMATDAIVVEVFQPGLKWWADRPPFLQDNKNKTDESGKKCI